VRDKLESNTRSTKRAALPRYHRSAYKIFFYEKRTEIINSRLKAYDESLERLHRQVNIQPIIYLPQLTAEINQMWKNMTPQDRDKFKGRAVVDMKRKRASMQDPPSIVRVSISERSNHSLTNIVETSSKIGESYSTDEILETFDVLGDDNYMSENSLDANTTTDRSILHDKPRGDRKASKDINTEQDMNIVMPWNRKAAVGRAGWDIGGEIQLDAVHPCYNDTMVGYHSKQSDPSTSSSLSSPPSKINADSVLSANGSTGCHHTTPETQWILVIKNPFVPWSYDYPNKLAMGSNVSSSATVGAPPLSFSATQSHFVPSSPNVSTASIPSCPTVEGYSSWNTPHFPLPYPYSYPPGAYMYGYPLSNFPPHLYNFNMNTFPSPYPLFQPMAMTSTDASPSDSGIAIIDINKKNADERSLSSMKS